jgi:hypothetical protein
MKKALLYISFLLGAQLSIIAQSETGFQIARLKYGGGGDWYNDPSADVNLLRYIGENTNIKVNPEYTFVDISTNDIFSYPMLFITGHGNIIMSDSEAERLKKYMELGGFIYVDDDYGIDKSFRREIKKIFGDNRLIELPFNHPIYNIVYDFPDGPPKIHEHDNKPPQGFGIFIEERLALYYTYESNPGDGWADPNVHNDPEHVREAALKFGTNIIVYALSD